MRICYPFVGDTVGGSHISASRLIRRLPSEISPLVVLHRDGPLASYLEQQRIGYELAADVRLVSPGATIPDQIMTMVAAASGLMAFLHARKIDVVHTNDGRMHLTWGLAAKMAGTAFVWHQRSAEPSRRLAVYSRLADAVLTVSQFCKSQLTRSMSRRALVVLNPFDPTPASFDRVATRRSLLAEMGITDETTKVIAFIAHLTPRKRPLVFVEMAARLMERTERPLAFPLFGEPREPLRQEVDALIERRGLRGRCKLMGTRFPIEPWIAASDMIVAPAVAEPFGRAVVEPTLVSTPVIAADDGGNREIIIDRKTGLLVRPDDPTAFADAVMHLVERPDFAAELAEAAMWQARQRFSDENHVNRVLQIYKEIAPRRKLSKDA